MAENQRDFKGVWIPRTVWLDDKLNALDKVILTEIDSLDMGEDGCWASNKYIADFCQCSETKVSTAVSKLIERGYLYVKSFDGRQRVLKSRLSNFERQDFIICNADSQNLKQSNTYNNTKNKTSKKDNTPKHKRGEYGNVLLTEEQEQKLMDEYGEIVTIKAIEFLDEYIEEKGYKAKNHYLTIRRWVIDAVKERAPKDRGLGNSFDTDDFFEAALQKHARVTAATDEGLRERANALKERLG